MIIPTLFCPQALPIEFCTTHASVPAHPIMVNTCDTSAVVLLVVVVVRLRVKRVLFKAENLAKSLLDSVRTA